VALYETKQTHISQSAMPQAHGVIVAAKGPQRIK